MYHDFGIWLKTPYRLLPEYSEETDCLIMMLLCFFYSSGKGNAQNTFTTTRRTFCKAANVSEQTFRTFIERMSENGTLSIRTSKDCTIITINRTDLWYNAWFRFPTAIIQEYLSKNISKKELKMFLACFMLANRSLLSGLGKGQFMAKLEDFSDQTGESIKSVRTFFDKFSKMGILTQGVTQRKKAVTINNIDSWFNDDMSKGHENGSVTAAQGQQNGTITAAIGHENGSVTAAQGQQNGTITAAIGHENGSVTAPQGHHNIYKSRIDNNRIEEEKEIKKDGSEKSENFDLYKEYYTESEAREIVKFYNVQIKDEYIGNFTEINNVKYKYSAGILNALGKYLENNPKARKNAGQGKNQAPQPPAPATPAEPVANVWLQKNAEQRERIGLMKI